MEARRLDRIDARLFSFLSGYSYGLFEINLFARSLREARFFDKCQVFAVISDIKTHWQILF